MPNHVHLMNTLLPGLLLSQILNSLKSYTARQANIVLGKTGSFWAPDYYDRYIRDSDHYKAVLVYIGNSPVKVGLCEFPNDSMFGSASIAGTADLWSAGGALIFDLRVMIPRVKRDQREGRSPWAKAPSGKNCVGKGSNLRPED